MVPAESQAMTWPWPSVTVMIVLLNEAFTKAIALPTFLRTRFFLASTTGFSVELMSLPEDLLVGDRLARTLAATGVAARALAAHRQAAAVAETAIALDLLQTVDVLQDLAAQGALDGIVLLDVGG